MGARVSMLSHQFGSGYGWLYAWFLIPFGAQVQEQRIHEERRLLFSQRKWKEAEAHFLISLPVILARI